MMKQNPENNYGFTLIEVIIYSGLTALIFGFILLAVYQIIDSSEALNAKNEIVTNSDFVVRKLEWALKNVSSISAPVAGTAGGFLTINRFDLGATPLKFYATGTTLFLQQGSGPPESLTNSFVKISDVSFSNFVFSTSTRNTIEFKAVFNDITSRPSSSTIDVFIPIQ